MMVRVNDRQRGFEHVLDMPREPLVARGEMPGRRDGYWGCHVFLLSSFSIVMAGFDPAIDENHRQSRTHPWMPGTSPNMTIEEC
jgi:hypothetical protein